MVLRLQRVSAEQVGSGAQLKFLFEPRWERFPWNSWRMGSAPFPLALPVIKA